MIGDSTVVYPPVGETAAQALNRLTWREEQKAQILAQVRAAVSSPESFRADLTRLTGKGQKVDVYI